MFRTVQTVALALVACAAVSVGAAPAPASEHRERRQVRIGISVDGPWVNNEMIHGLTISEVEALTQAEFDVQFPDEFYLIGDWTYETAQANLLELLDTPEVDLIITWGLLGSHATCCLGDPVKPVLAPVVLDAALQNLPFSNGTSGVRNLNYVALPHTMPQELDRFQSIVPFRKVAIIANAALLDAIPQIIEQTARSLAGTGIDVEYVPAVSSAAQALSGIPPDAEAVYVWPQFQFSEEEYAKLIAGLIEGKLPTFSGLGLGDVEAGMLASAGSPEFFPKLARRLALNVQRILLGEDAGDLPVSFDVRDNLVINMATARKIGVSPRWEVLIEAEVLHAEDLEGAYELSLDKAVAEAIVVNLDLAVRKRVVAAGEYEIDLAKSNLRPQLGLSGQSVRIDSDRAEASFGSQAEQTTLASAGLDQLLFSDAAFANVAIQKRLQEALEFDLEALRLDIALDSAVTYLNLMRAKALERVQKNNVDRTRSNLELAQIRREIGVASAGEVFRWESELASARKSLVESFGDRRSAEIAVNRLLHRPLEDPFITQEVTLETPGFATGEGRYRKYVDTPNRYRIFRDFVVLTGLDRSPELKQLDAGIAAQERALTTAKRAYFLPTVALRAALDEALSKSGAGSDSSPGLGLPTPDDSSWSVAVNASYSLFSGGSRAAERAQAEIDLQGLQLERTAVGEKVEERIRIALEQSRASFVGIRLANQAADAAMSNLELAEDAYARGVASLLDLLDAQTAALNAEEVAANALYDFLIVWLEAQRAANTLDFFFGEAERSAWFDELEAYAAAQGPQVRD